MAAGGRRSRLATYVCALQRLLCVFGLTLAVTSCSYSYVDATGARRVIGFVNLTVKTPGESQTLAGEVYDFTAIGFAFHRTATDSGASFGYSRLTVAAIRNNAFIEGNPLLALRQVTDTTREESNAE